MRLTRSEFLKLAGIGGIAGLTAPLSGFSGTYTKRHKPSRLNYGATIALVSPASRLHEPGRYNEIGETIEQLGFRVKQGSHARQRYGYLAGSDADRASDLNAAFTDPEVDAILPYRGGWGSNRILNRLDYESIAAHPKPLVGFSDITSLLLAIYAKTGLVTFHGPVGKSEWTEFTVRHFESILIEAEAPTLMPADGESVRTIRPGTAEGVLLGGNLTVLTSMLGSGYLPDFDGVILFLEDVGEEYYRIDRMLTQLKLSGILEQINGFVFGRCTECEAGSEYSLTLEQIFDDHIYPLGIPAFQGSAIGHIDNMFTLPLGIDTRIDADKGSLTLMEPAVR